MSYLCNRNRETKIANDKVPWMSGLVSGLQNRVRRFESARNLQKQERIKMKISNPFVFQQLTSSVVEVEKGGLSTPATPLEMLRLYSSLYKLYYRHPSACEIKQQTVFTPYDECEYFMDGCDIMLDQLYSYPLGLKCIICHEQRNYSCRRCRRGTLQLIRQRQTSSYHQRIP